MNVTERPSDRSPTIIGDPFNIQITEVAQNGMAAKTKTVRAHNRSPIRMKLIHYNEMPHHSLRLH